MLYLPPLILREKYYASVEQEIKRIFFELIYRPLFDLIGEKPQEVTNALATPLAAAIKAGRVWYEDGQFKGTFNAAISRQLRKLGANYNARTKTWHLKQDYVPADIKFAQTQANAALARAQRSMLTALDSMNAEDIHSISKTQEHYETTLGQMEIDFQKTIPEEKSVSDAPATARSRIAIEAKLTPEMKAAIAKEWGENLDLYIKGWAKENILKLRAEIQPHVIAGGRANGLVESLQKNYGVGVRKAKFLARQETSLLMSKFQESRYKDIGIQRYRWSDSHDRRVRHDHHELNGKIFSFSSPPITNKKTGARNNPGQDYNCRCVAIPIVD